MTTESTTLDSTTWMNHLSYSRALLILCKKNSLHVAVDQEYNAFWTWSLDVILTEIREKEGEVEKEAIN